LDDGCHQPHACGWWAQGCFARWQADQCREPLEYRHVTFIPVQKWRVPVRAGLPFRHYSRIGVNLLTKFTPVV